MNPNIFIVDKENTWSQTTINGHKIFYSGYAYNYDFKIFLRKFIKKIEKNYNNTDRFFKKLELKGHFAIIIKKKNFLYAVTDNISSIPIFYYENKKDIVFSNSSNYLVKKFNKKLSLIKKQIKPFLFSGYTIGEETLFDKIKFLSSGQSILINSKKNTYQSNIFHFNQKINLNQKELKIKLFLVIKNIFLDLIKSLDNRQVAISLSAGYDSRLVLSMLKELNYENIICYSYGMKNNSESTVAKKICEKLKVKYYFDELDLDIEKKFYKSKIFKKYLNFSNMHHSIQYFQGISTLDRMKKKKLIKKDAIIITGNSGDYITGLHLSGFLKQKIKNKKNIYDFILDKHFNLWSNKDLNLRKEITSLVQNQKKMYQKRSIKKLNLNDFYEFYEYENRQSKYVVNINRVAEFFGFDWRMPLWDSRFINFWNCIPDKYKIDQKLYVNTINTYNPGNVWRKTIPVNKKKVYPITIRYLRNIFKLFFIIMGKKSKDYWHKFDIKYFYYFYDVTRMVCLYPYKEYIKSKNSSTGLCHVSIQSKKYVEKYEKLFEKN